jgi:hypothetical protein
MLLGCNYCRFQGKTWPATMDARKLALLLSPVFDHRPPGRST